MEMWEYDKEVLHDDDIPMRLNIRAEAGWELVSLVPYRMNRPLFSPVHASYTTREYLAVYKRCKP